MNGEEVQSIKLDEAIGASRQALVAAAHELKAPLSLIRMYAAALQEGDITEADRQKYYDRISLTADHLLQLTKGMVEGYRWQDKQLPLEPVNAHVVCEEVLHSLAPYARELDQTLRYSPTRKQYVAVAHRLFLKNVLFNIACNALQHTPAKTTVTIGHRLRQDRVFFDVLDSGPGFQKSTLRAINRAVGAELQPVQSRSGTGLGLAVAKQLADAMGGSLQLTASQRGGHCSLILPMSRQLSLVS